MVRIVRAGTTARRVAAAVPVIALVTAGITFAATRGTDSVQPTSAITVPDQAITQGSPLYPQAGPAPAPMQLPPIYQTFTQDYARVDVPPEARGAISAIDSLAPVRLDANGIPAVALAAYQRAAGVLDGIKPGCGVDWALLGAIGRVESNHARFGGNVLDASGIARPGIIGIPLDGSQGTARITDTDGGALDRDPVYDRAVGPMQFIPSSWKLAGRDGDGDGVANPQSLTDAVTGAGVLLCSGGTDLRQPRCRLQGRDALQPVRRLRPHGPVHRRRVPPRRDRGPDERAPRCAPGCRQRLGHPRRLGLRVCRFAGPPSGGFVERTPHTELLGEAVTRTVQPAALGALRSRPAQPKPAPAAGAERAVARTAGAPAVRARCPAAPGAAASGSAAARADADRRDRPAARPAPPAAAARRPQGPRARPRPAQGQGRLRPRGQVVDLPDQRSARLGPRLRPGACRPARSSALGRGSSAAQRRTSAATTAIAMKSTSAATVIRWRNLKFTS